MQTEAPKHATLKERALEEFKIYWVITLYLALFLGSFTVYRRLVLKEFGVAYLHYGFALIEALIIAKVILIGRAFGLGKRFERAPLLLSALYKSILFGGLVFLFGLLEHVVEAFIHKTSWTGVQQAASDLGFYELLARIIMLIVAFVPFFAFWEVGRVLGPGRLSTLFFSRQGAASSSEPRP
jgi:hypothetical protein